MNDKILENIELFFNYFERVHDSIRKAQFEFESEVHQSILYFSIVDTLSKCVYPQMSNKEKFVNFIDNYSGWNNVDRISSVQLYYYLLDKGDRKYESLKYYAISKIKSMHRGNIYPSDFDDYLSNIQFSSELRKEIIEFSYSRLLYQYRNYVVHEFQKPGRGFHFTNTDNIYYCVMKHIGAQDNLFQSVELVIPINYISLLVINSITNLRKYCIENQINPYDYYPFESLWKSYKKNNQDQLLSR